MPRFLKFVGLVPVLLGLVYAPSPSRGADSYNELFGLGSHSVDANLEGWWKLQDDAANTTIADSSGSAITGTLSGGDNTADLSTTGPVSGGYLAKALAFDGSADYVDLGTSSRSSFTGASQLTVNMWLKSSDTTTNMVAWGEYEGTANGDAALNTRINASSAGWIAFSLRTDGSDDTYAGRVETNTGVTDGSWHFLTFAGDVDSDANATCRVDGGAETITVIDTDADGTTVPALDYNIYLGAESNVGTAGSHFNGDLAGVSLFSRRLTPAEQDEIYNGPEPIYSGGGISSPVGTYTVGQTLTAVTDSGNWDTQSNGTLVYAYQWIRADDGTGTNAAEISGATSSTYTLVSGDSGKHIACDILASNDGGSDAAEETRSAYTSQVSGGGGGPAITPITTSIPGSSVDPIRGTIP